jgi:hypothetical protein
MARQNPAIDSKPLALQRLIGTWLVALTFLFQGAISQGHIHMPGESAGVTWGVHFSRDLAKSPAKPSGKVPSPDDPANCPFCQVAGQAGHYLTPAVAALILPASIVFIVPPAASLPSLASHTQHGWQSRAPPQN